MRTFNRIESKKKRQYLRNNVTNAEKLLWSRLRGKRLSGLKFRRQCGIGNYIVDFYCPELKLAIEIDGDVHGYQTQRNKDMRKQEYLINLGIKLLRFTNGDITESMDGVLQQILSNHPSSPSLSKEGEF
ncbi:endonuclease domain-containing protein [bacterium]|nr:endonuclease domain-containing protein [bacterium]